MTDWHSTPVVLHIGLPKCASTTLQSYLFRRHPEVFFLGIYRPVHEWDPDGDEMRASPGYQYLMELKNKEELAFDQARMDDLLPTPNPNQIAVLSDEDFSFADKVDRAEKARRLKASFPNATILFVLRHPVAWVESWYLFEMRKRTDFVDFDTWMTQNWANKDKFEKSVLRVLRYNALIQHYANLFGQEAIQIVFLEDLAKDQRAFMTDVCQKIGIDPTRIPEDATAKAENVRLPASMLTVAQKAPFLYSLRGMVPGPMRKSIRSFLSRSGKKAAIEIPDRWRKEIEEFCAPSLTELDQRFALNLADRGYPVHSSKS